MPSVSTSFDQQCNITKRTVELSVEQVDMFNGLHCHNSHSCKAEFVSTLFVAAVALPVSAIVSGSIALVGNSIYWLQEKSKC